VTIRCYRCGQVLAREDGRVLSLGRGQMTEDATILHCRICGRETVWSPGDGARSLQNSSETAVLFKKSYPRGVLVAH
jgi:ribosomal protein S27E